MNKLRLRLEKGAFAISHTRCWTALMHGVAPSIEHADVLRDINIDLLLDVGANRGQFSLISRMLQPHAPIHAYEPLQKEAEVYRKIFWNQPGLTLHEIALGDFSGRAKLHISNYTDSSSLLDIGALQTEFFPGTHEVGTRWVLVEPLDTLVSHWQAASRALLKIDVQGFELSVLRGAQRALRHCAYVYVECSDVTLYRDQALFPGVAAFLHNHGLLHQRRLNASVVGNAAVQADHLFARP